MIRNLVTYDELAPSIIVDLSALDRDSVEARNAMEALSVLNSIRDSQEMGRSLVPDNTVAVLASSGWFLSVHPNEADAQVWLATQEKGQDRDLLGGFAVVEADRTGTVDRYRILTPQLGA